MATAQQYLMATVETTVAIVCLAIAAVLEDSRPCGVQCKGWKSLML